MSTTSDGVTASPRNPGPELHEGVAFVTGGNSGLGRACAEAFGAAGSKVMVAGRDEARCAEVVDQITSRGGQAAYVVCDVSEQASIEAAVDACVSTFGRLDFAINSAGMGGSPTRAPLAQMSVDAFDTIIAVNLRGMFLSLRAELAVMERQGSGSIVNIASVAGMKGTKYSAAYSSSKHGVLALTKTAALDYAEMGIRTNAICPGMIATPMVTQKMTPERRAAVQAIHPMNRVGIPEEVASAALWLCSQGASFTTGIALPIDGGTAI